jgi:hypothetical protein
MSEDPSPEQPTPEKPVPYVAPAVLWEEELPQGPGVFSACGKIGGTGGPCNSSPGS